MHEYPESWVWWVREKCIDCILQRSITPNDPDSPHLGKKSKKRKGMPLYSPLKCSSSKAKKSPAKRKPSKPSTGKGKKTKGDKGVPLRFSNLREKVTKTPTPKKSVEAKAPSSARRRVFFGDEEDDEEEGQTTTSTVDPNTTENPQVTTEDPNTTEDPQVTTEEPNTTENPEESVE